MSHRRGGTDLDELSEAVAQVTCPRVERVCYEIVTPGLHRIRGAGHARRGPCKGRVRHDWRRVLLSQYLKRMPRRVPIRCATYNGNRDELPSDDHYTHAQTRVCGREVTRCQRRRLQAKTSTL